MMRLRSGTAVVAATIAATAALGGCHPAKLGQGTDRGDRPVSVPARLDCPQTQGALTRVEQAADGRSCRYKGPDGREAKIGFLDLAGRPAKEALAATEAELRAQVPAAAAPAAPPEPPAEPGHTGGEKTRIDLPGIHIETDGNDGARIRAFGQTVNARGKEAVITSAWNGKVATVNAHDGGAEIRTGAFGVHAVSAEYLLASDAPGPGGVRAAGYVVKGPAAGPLVLGVETLKSPGDHEKHDRAYRDLKDLVQRNVR